MWFVVLIALMISIDMTQHELAHGNLLRSVAKLVIFASMVSGEPSTL